MPCDRCRCPSRTTQRETRDCELDYVNHSRNAAAHLGQCAGMTRGRATSGTFPATRSCRGAELRSQSWMQIGPPSRSSWPFWQSWCLPSCEECGASGEANPNRRLADHGGGSSSAVAVRRASDGRLGQCAGMSPDRFRTPWGQPDQAEHPVEALRREPVVLKRRDRPSTLATAEPCVVPAAAELSSRCHLL